MQAHYQQQYQPYPPQYQYFPQPPPRQGLSNEKIIGIIVVLVVLMVMIPIIAGVLSVYMTSVSSPPDHNYPMGYPVGMSAANDSNGDWLISINSGGGQNLKDVTLQVTNTTNGARVLYTKLNAIPKATGTYNDNNGDYRINSGDSILLKRGGSVIAGMKVQLLRGESAIGNLKELPA